MNEIDLDDELGQRIRAANPLPADPDERPGARALAIRQSIMAASTTAPTAQPVVAMRRRRVALWAPLIAAAVVVVAVVLAVIPSRSAVALGPAPLAFSGTGQSAREVLAIAHAALRQADVYAEPRRGSTTVGWYLDQDHTGDEIRVLISPEVTVFAWNADLSGRVTVTAGHPYWADGATDAVPASAAQEPGTVLSDMTFEPGTFTSPTIEAPGATPDELNAYLETLGMPTDADAADIVDWLTTAFSYWTMSDEQHAAALELILNRTDVRVLGTTTDRAGRPVIGVATESARFPGVRRILLISTQTGRIAGTESIRTTATTAIPAGTVIGYNLWDTTPQ